MTDLLKAMKAGLHYLDAKLTRQLFFFEYRGKCEVCVLTALAIGLQPHGTLETDNKRIDFVTSLVASREDEIDSADVIRSYVYGAIQEHIPVPEKDLRDFEVSYDAGDLTAEQVIEELQKYVS